MRYIKLIPRPRLLGRLLFVVLVTALLVPLSTSTGAQAANGSPSTLAPTVAGISCALQFEAAAGFNLRTAPNGTTTGVRGVCSWSDDTSQASQLGRALLGGVSGATPLNYMNMCSTTGTCLTVRSAANNALYYPLVSNFTSAPGTAARSVEFSFTIAKPVSAGTEYGVATIPSQARDLRWVSTSGDCTGLCATQTHTSLNPSLVAGYSLLYDLPRTSVNFATAPLDPPLYYWNEPWTAPLANRCEAVQIGVQVNGDALTVADYDDVLYPRSSEPEQDDFVFVLTANDWNMLTDPGGLVFTYQWPNTGWLPITEVLDRVALNGGVDSAMTFRLSSADLRYLSQVQFRCIDTQVEGDLEQRRHLAFWDPGPSVPLPNWTLGASYQSACRALTFTRATGMIQPGQTTRVAYNLGGDDGLDLAVFAYGVANFGPTTTPSIMPYSTNLLGGATGGPPPALRYVAPGSGWLVFTLPATVAEPVAFADLVFACTDDIEAGLIVAGSADLGLSGSFTQPEATCWEQGGMSLTSPASWISGIARMIACVSHELLVPDSASLLDQVQEVNATVAERPPFVAVAAIVGFAGDLSDSFSATSGSGCFTGPSIPGVTASSQACAGAAINVEPSQRSTMALLLTAPMILGLAGHMFGLLRGQSEYITEDNGQMAMRL